MNEKKLETGNDFGTFFKVLLRYVTLKLRSQSLIIILAVTLRPRICEKTQFANFTDKKLANVQVELLTEQ